MKWSTFIELITLTVGLALIVGIFIIVFEFVKAIV